MSEELDAIVKAGQRDLAQINKDLDDCGLEGTERAVVLLALANVCHSSAAMIGQGMRKAWTRVLATYVRQLMDMEGKDYGG